MNELPPDSTTLSAELRALRLYKLELEMQNEELRAAQAALQEERARFRDLYDNAPVAYVTLTADGSMVDANIAAASLLKRERHTLIGRRLGVFVREEDRGACQRMLDEQFRTGFVAPCEVRVGAEHEPARTVLISCAPLSDRTLSRVTLTDVTWRRQTEDGIRLMEKSLHDAQRMEAIGRLAGGIAHDFNNLLTVVCANSELLALDLPANDPRQELVQQIAKAGERAAEVTSQLLAFSRKQVLAVRIVDANLIVINVVRMLARVVGEQIKLRTQFSATPALVEIDPAQLEQVLVNLAVNARDAMPAGGAIRFSTGIETIAEQLFDAVGTIPPGTYVKIAVRDTGDGIDPQIIHRIFEPFFTTKALGRGTGLGLSMAYGVIAQSRGHISVASTTGAGTVFTIHLPLCSPAELQEASALPRGTETVLLIEDELSSIFARSQHTLTALGYTVIPVTNVELALRAIGERREEIDLVLVVQPPHGSEVAEGARSDVAARVHAYRTGLPVLSLPADQARHGNVDALVSPLALAIAVRRRLDADRRAGT